MNDQNKTKRQLLEELARLRQKVAALETAAANGPGSKINNAPKKGKRPPFNSDAGEIKTFFDIEALVRCCINKVPDGICLTSSTGKIMYANGPAAANLGYSVEELTGMTMGEIDASSPRGAWKKIWTEIQQQGSFFFEKLHVRKDGSLLPVEVMATHISFSDKEFGLFHTQDISGR